MKKIKTNRSNWIQNIENEYLVENLWVYKKDKKGGHPHDEDKNERIKDHKNANSNKLLTIII